MFNAKIFKWAWGKKDAEAFLQSLPDDAQWIVFVLTTSHGRVYGDLSGKGDVMVTTLSQVSARKTQEFTHFIADGGALVARMVRLGWLRHHTGPGVGDGGYFWLTDDALRILRRAIGLERN